MTSQWLHQGYFLRLDKALAEPEDIIQHYRMKAKSYPPWTVIDLTCKILDCLFTVPHKDQYNHSVINTPRDHRGQTASSSLFFLLILLHICNHIHCCSLSCCFSDYLHPPKNNNNNNNKHFIGAILNKVLTVIPEAESRVQRCLSRAVRGQVQRCVQELACT